STRPDYIDEERIAVLKRYSVQTVEIGAQSMIDGVLERSKRGHTSHHVRRAVDLLKNSGFETGIHLMAGLPGDTHEGFRYTVDEVIALRPHMIRIHPTVVLAETELADMYRRGDYTPLTLSEAVSLCGDALGKFEVAGIPVIRMGLQMTEEMERKGAIVAGPHHPAFRSLVQSSLLYARASELLAGAGSRGKVCTFRLNPKDVSDFRGKGNGNIELLKDRFHLPDIRIITEPEQPRGTVVMVTEETTCGTGSCG
ncbi:MAG: radical SAM protein, partial [Deltaproteobacteria bacterium]|nr:radical SAM protein [Deltaproteobacteria bacterium]